MQSFLTPTIKSLRQVINSRVQTLGSKSGEFSSQTGISSTFSVHISSCLPCEIKHENGLSRSWKGTKLAKDILGWNVLKTWYNIYDVGLLPEKNTEKSHDQNYLLRSKLRTEVKDSEGSKWFSSHEMKAQTS